MCDGLALLRAKVDKLIVKTVLTKLKAWYITSPFYPLKIPDMTFP